MTDQTSLPQELLRTKAKDFGAVWLPVHKTEGGATVGDLGRLLVEDVLCAPLKIGLMTGALLRAQRLRPNILVMMYVYLAGLIVLLPPFLVAAVCWQGYRVVKNLLRWVTGTLSYVDKQELLGTTTKKE